MNQSVSLSKRSREILTEGEWVTGTNFKREISDLDWQKAVLKVHNLNSIADLTFHCNYYIAGVTQVLEGGPLAIRDQYSYDYPPIQSYQEWRNIVDKFCSDAERLIEMVEKISDTDLSSDFVDPKYGDFERNINVIIEHTYYHFGQVLLIKKLIRQNET